MVENKQKKGGFELAGQVMM
jgi:hypothetical protein